MTILYTNKNCPHFGAIFVAATVYLYPCDMGYVLKYMLA